MKALIFGAKGNLGSELVRAFQTAGHEVVALDRDTLDVTDSAALRFRINAEQPNVIINAVAWNDVDGAEDVAKQPLVTALNSVAPGVMAEAAHDVRAAFVHYSTDYVFSGTKPEGYIESDAPDPISFYGESKAAGEQAALETGGQTYIVRTSKIFGPQGPSPAAKPSFVNVMIRLAGIKPELTIVDEEVGMPTYTRDVAEATVRLLSSAHEAGVYHFVNEGPGVTWFSFAEEFFGLLGITTPRKPVPMSAFPRPARRPLLAALRNTKFPPLRTRLEALRAFFEEYPPAKS